MKKLFMGALLFAVALFGFSTVFASAELAGTSWTAVSFNGAEVDFEGSLEFDDTTMYSKFCNNVSQGYIYTGDTLTASGAGISTMMYCEGTPMDMEMAFQLYRGHETPVMMSGEMLTITTSGDNVFVFEASDPVVCTMQYEPVCGEDGMTYGNTCTAGAANVVVAYEGECIPEDPANDETCVSMFDGCNTCVRTEGEDVWACTKMFCETPTEAYCIEHTAQVDANGCVEGEMWSQSQKACVTAESNTGASSLEVAYDFAFNVGMTTMETLPTFRSDDVITRQEAAKMFVALAVGAYDKDAEASSELCVTYSDDAIFDYTLRPFIYSACAHGMMKGSQGAFMPNGSLTRGETLTVLMRTIDGMQTEPDTGSRWMPYVDRAAELDLLEIDSVDNFNEPITRGELIIWAEVMTTAHMNK